MKKAAKTIRIITVAPLVAVVLINLLYFVDQSLRPLDYFVAIMTLSVFPLIAYPLSQVINRGTREKQRELAIIFSNIGYLIGLAIALLTNTSITGQILFMTYFLSGIGIAYFTFVFKVNSSGHMCGLVGPIAMIVYVFGPIYLLLLFLAGLVIWSSLYLKRHRISELIIGGLVPIGALILSMLIFTKGGF